MDIIDQVLLYTAIILVLIAVLGAFAFFIYRKKFNYKIEVRKIINNRKVISDDIGMIYTSPDNKKFLKRWGGKADEKLMPVPPSEAEELDKKGKIRVIANQDGQGNYSYVTDTSDHKNLITLKSNQRIALANQIRKAESRKRFRWSDHITTFTNAAALVIIILSFMLFFGEVVEPAETIGADFARASEAFERAADRIASLEQNIQNLEDQSNRDIDLPEEPPQ